MQSEQVIDNHLADISFQIATNFNTLQALLKAPNAPASTFSANQRANRTTELEIALFRLGSLASVIDSISNQDKCSGRLEGSLGQLIVE